MIDFVLGWIFLGLISLLFWLVSTIFRNDKGINLPIGTEFLILLAMITGPITYVWAYFVCEKLKIKND